MPLLIEEIKIRLKKKNLILKSKYKNAHSKIKVSCTKCKKGKIPYKITAQQAWSRGCKYCNLKNLYVLLEKKVYSKRRLTHKEFKKRIHSDLKILGTYLNNDTVVDIECLRCNKINSVYPSRVLNGKHNCNYCGPKKTGKKKQLKFLITLDKRLKQNNLIRISEYNGKRKPITLKCLNCNHEWTKEKAGTGLSGCPDCSHKKLGLTNRLNEKKVKDILNQKSIMLISKFNGTLEPAKLKCENCKKEWDVKKISAALYVNKGCRICSKRYNGAYSMKLFKLKPYLKKVKGKTYFLACKGNKESFYKIGITRQKWRERLRKIPYKTKILSSFEGKLPECTELEIKLKKDYKRYQYRPKLYFGGVAECFKFNKNKIKEINRIFK